MYIGKLASYLSKIANKYEKKVIKKINCYIPTRNNLIIIYNKTKCW